MDLLELKWTQAGKLLSRKCPSLCAWIWSWSPGECCRLLYLMFEAEAIQFLQAMPFFSISLFLLCLFPSASWEAERWQWQHGHRSLYIIDLGLVPRVRPGWRGQGGRQLYTGWGTAQSADIWHPEQMKEWAPLGRGLAMMGCWCSCGAAASSSLKPAQQCWEQWQRGGSILTKPGTCSFPADGFPCTIPHASRGNAFSGWAHAPAASLCAGFVLCGDSVHWHTQGRGRAASGSSLAALSRFSWCQKHPIPHSFSSGRCSCDGNLAGKWYMGGPSWLCKDISLAKKAITIVIIVKSKTFRFSYLYFLDFANMPHHILMMFPLVPYLKWLYIVDLQIEDSHPMLNRERYSGISSEALFST